jgi:SAM-dependent methyltransferase
MMPSAILERLLCPECGDRVVEEDGGFSCGNGHRLLTRDGYLDASTVAGDDVTARTLESFGYEWTRFAELRPEDEEFWKEYFADVPLAELRGRVGLDAGCGKGRYTRFTARHLEAMVALDGSDAIAVAARHLAHLGNVVAVRADLRRPPFAAQSFGFVSCLGVLHHLADPEAGFDALARLLAPDGILLVYLYSQPQGRGLRATCLRAATGLRKLTVRVPHPLLRLLSVPIAAALYGAFVVPGRLGQRVGSSKLSGLPLATYRGRPVRTLWLDTFDRLSAPVERRYAWADVEPWFQRAGLRVESVSGYAGLTIVARRIAAADRGPET